MYTAYQGDPNSDKVYIFNKDNRSFEEKIIKTLSDSGKVRYLLERNIKDYLELNAYRILEKYLPEQIEKYLNYYLSNNGGFNNKVDNYTKQIISNSVINEMKKAFSEDLELSIK